MNIQTEIIFDSGTENFEFSLRKQKYIIDQNGTRYNVGDPHRRAVTPLDMDMVLDFIQEEMPTAPITPAGIAPVSIAPKAFVAASTPINPQTTHPIAKILDTLWTPEIKEAYKAKIAAQEALETTEEG